MKILVTYAVQGEFTELKFPGLIGEEEVHIGDRKSTRLNSSHSH